MFSALAKSLRPSRRRQILILGWVTGVILLSAATVNAARAPAQPAPNASPTVSARLFGLGLDSVNRFFGTSDALDLATGAVRLDGRQLFIIAAPRISTPQGEAPSPIQQRVDSIETRLQQLASATPNPATLEVSVQIDSSSGLPVLSVNDQYLMTVTRLDAALQSSELNRLATNYAATIRQALITYQQERQSSFLIRQGVLASGILLLLLAGNLAANYGQRQLRARARRQQLFSDRPVEAPPPDSTAAASDRPETSVQQQMQRRQARNFNEIQRWLLQVIKYALWGGGLFLILGLFPYSRWLQPAILSALQVPLKLLGLGLGVYLLIRISFVFIDRFFAALGQRDFLGPESSQRLTLRTSTFSRVLQSVTAITLLGAGILTSLAVVGVNLVPLLAGAGVIGLALSLASQSLLKDAINGFLILLEDQYGVGDVIAVGEVSGLVEYMNLRITQLRNNEGRLITIPNSEIKIVQNLSKDWSRVDLEIRVAYQENPDRVLSVIDQVGEELYRQREWWLKMPEPPEVLGIDELDHGGMLVRVWIKTLPLEQWNVSREFRRRLKLALDAADITIGMPQQSLRFQDSLALENGKAAKTQDAPKPPQS